MSENKNQIVQNIISKAKDLIIQVEMSNYHDIELGHKLNNNKAYRDLRTIIICNSNLGGK